MITGERHVQLGLRFSCRGAAIVGVIAPTWEERWTVWGVVASGSFIILIVYGYWRLIPLEALAAKKIVALLHRLES